MICWKVDKNSPLPIYKQLVNLVRDSVASGQLRKGEVLPSQRQLAKLLGLSRATIVTVSYTHLTLPTKAFV